MRKIVRSMSVAAVISGAFLSLTAPAFAHCPLCSAITGATVVGARAFGISDLTSGALIGAFTASTALWVQNILKKRNKGRPYFPMQALVILLISLAMTLPTFSILGSGFESLFFGTLAGAAVITSALTLHLLIKKRAGRSLIPFQPIVLAISATLALAFGIEVFA